MTLSIIIPNIKFPRRTQLYSIPALAKNHVFSFFGASREKSLVNHNASQPHGIVVGDVAFSADGLLVLGKTNALRFKGLRAPDPAGCTILVAFKTGKTIGDAGLVSYWSEASMFDDSLARRIYSIWTSTSTTFNGVPGVTSAAAGRVITPDTEYILSLTRASKGNVSQLRVHNPDGSVASTHAITEYAGTTLPYASDVVFDIGTGSSAAQVGAYIKGAALWSGILSEAEIAAGAALMYQVIHPS
ncbi:hypothetical protein [Pseudomonas putida]|uniref:hypothetical protein n=1 Tax=Pseudomonas putida TaxID=303 RepID=UPI00236320A7|nr:hypothetical protein [Pseudomonas putida]MDD1988157.1 hypothetical protein [Pseudomonas putida]HDS1793002.1 hypothetical protein [Pseudomonas putida]